MKKLILYTLLIFMAACSETKEGGVSSLPSVKGIPLTEGTWKTQCLSVTTGGTVKLQNVFATSGSAFESTAIFYSDNACGTQSYSIIQKGTYVLGSPTGSSGGVPIDPKFMDSYSKSNLDLTHDNIKVTPLTSTQAGVLNSESFCGLTNWAVNVSQEVSGATCRGETLPVSGDMDFDIVVYYFTVAEAANVAPLTLYFGLSQSGADGSSASARRKVTNGNIGYTK